MLNLGAGVQSTTVFLLSHEGRIPPIDHAIFADTQEEPAAVYQHLQWMRTIPAPVPVLHVASKSKEDQSGFTMVLTLEKAFLISINKRTTDSGTATLKIALIRCSDGGLIGVPASRTWIVAKLLLGINFNADEESLRQCHYSQDPAPKVQLPVRLFNRSPYFTVVLDGFPIDEWGNRAYD